MINIVNLEEFKQNVVNYAEKLSNTNAVDFTDYFLLEVLKYINSELIDNLIKEKDKHHVKIEFNESKIHGYHKSMLILKGNDDEILLIIDASGYENEILNGYDYGDKIISIQYFIDSLIEKNIFINYSFINKNKLCFYRNTIDELSDIEKAKDLFQKIYYNTKKYMVYIGNEKYSGTQIETRTFDTLENIPKNFTELFRIPCMFRNKMEFNDFANLVLALKPKESRNIILHKFFNEHLVDVGFIEPNDLNVFLDNISKIKNIKKGFKIGHAFCLYSKHQKIKADYVYIKIYAKVQCKNTRKVHWWDNFFSFKLYFNDKFEDALDKSLHILYPDFKEIEGVTVNDYINNRSEVHRLINLMNY